MSLEVEEDETVETIEGAAPRGSQAFEEILSRNLDALYRLARRLCPEPSDAEDLLQDAVLRAFRHRAQLRDPGAGRTWMLRILHRTHLNRVRDEGRRRERVESDLGEAEFEAALAAWTGSGDRDWLDRLADREAVRQAVDRIDPRYRIVLLLSDVEEHSQREVAEILDLPEGTVASRLFRARRALRELLATDAGIEERSVG